MCVATIAIHIVGIGLDLLLQLVHGTCCNYIICLFYESSTHTFISVAIVPIYTIVIGLYLLLQLACDTICNLINFDFLIKA
jgi:hypothetical protein